MHRLSNDFGRNAPCREDDRNFDVTGYPKDRRSAPERLDGRQKVRGAVRFTTDFSLPGMVHAKVLRSPHPHARIRSIDTRRALELPGVLAVVTGADISAMVDPFYGVGIRDQ